MVNVSGVINNGEKSITVKAVGMKQMRQSAVKKDKRHQPSYAWFQPLALSLSVIRALFDFFDL